MKKAILGGLAALAALAIGLGVAPTANARPAGADESGYLNRLYEEGIYNVNGNQAMLTNGYAVCQRYRSGWSDTAVINEVMIWNPGLLNRSGAIEFIAISQVWLCPDTVPQTPPANPLPVRGGDLGLSTPMSYPACDGTGIVVLGSVTTPGQYDAGVQRLLTANPGASYLRTDQSCPSLRAADDDGNPIYAVYRAAGFREPDVCAPVRSAGPGAYGKRLDYTTNPSYIMPC